MIGLRLRLLTRDDNGATIVEFAMLAPVLGMLLMGMFDMGYNLYTASVLQGAINDAARNSSIEGATSGALDAEVEKAVRNIVPHAAIAFRRKSYTNFSDVGMAEDYSDMNGDGLCNNGEPFEDANGNSIWDADRGVTGMGGARDAVLYTVHVEYPRAFPIAGFIGLSNQYAMSAETVLRNQPYGQQVSLASTGNCA